MKDAAMLMIVCFGRGKALKALYAVGVVLLVAAKGRRIPGHGGVDTLLVALEDALVQSHHFTAESVELLRCNGGWGEITDIEEAADALAASWGVARPN